MRSKGTTGTTRGGKTGKTGGKLRVVARDGKITVGEGEALQLKPKVRGAILPGLGVTFKEEAFCQAMAKGATQSDAYRMSHDAQDMLPNTLWGQAVKVAGRPRVRERLRQLVEEGKGSELHSRDKALSWSLLQLQKLAEGAETDGAKVQAIALIMRHHALLTDKQEVDVREDRSADELEAAIKDKMLRLMGRAG